MSRWLNPSNLTHLLIFCIWWKKESKMKIEIYEHQTPDYALEPNETHIRICVCLKDNKGNFIDSFDYKSSTNQIRFYG